MRETQVRIKYMEAMIKKLPKKNQKYYVLDSELIGLRIYAQITGEKSFYLQRYLKEFRYSARYVVGGIIQVDEEKHFSNFKQEAKDQEIFTLIQDEIKKFKNRKHGWVPSQKVVKRGYVSMLIYLMH